MTAGSVKIGAWGVLVEMLRNLKHMAVEIGPEDGVLLFVDDKCNIEVGSPQHPKATLERGRRVMVLRGEEGERAPGVQAMDHDSGHSATRLIPSVIHDMTIPQDFDKYEHRGVVSVSLKDATTQPSTALRSATELSHYLQELERKTGQRKAALLLGTDGGPEHNTRNGAVKVALVSFFMVSGVDFLQASRTAPGNSYINPVERAWPLLNLAMNGVALDRDFMVQRDAYDEPVLDAQGKRVVNEQFERILTNCSRLAREE